MNLQSNRMSFKKEILKLQDELKEYIEVKDYGLTAYTKGIISKGCQSCKRGTWVCIFIGLRCNAGCSYCPNSPDVRRNHPIYEDMIGDQFMYLDDCKTILSEYGNYLEGVSYSGGEPTLYLTQVEILATHIRDNLKHVYQWLYTNGKLLTETMANQFAEWGIKEVRFDLSAFDFDKEIISVMKKVVHLFERVSVEIPSGSYAYNKLCEEKYINVLKESGIAQLNLAEQYINNWNEPLQVEPAYYYGSPWAQGKMLMDSRLSTYKIMKYAIDNKIDILINDCSQDTKSLQIMKRRTNFQGAPLFQAFGN